MQYGAGIWRAGPRGAISEGMSEAPRARRQVAEGVGARKAYAPDFEGPVVSAAKLRLILRAMNMEHATHKMVAAHVFDGRTTPRIVKSWRIGARYLPQWAIQLLTEKTARLAMLANEIPRGPGQRAGDKNLLRNAPQFIEGR